jgi:hypothetical protein
MLSTLAMASCQNVQILLRLALMLVYDLLVQLLKLFSRWEIKLLLERQPLVQVQSFLVYTIHYLTLLFVSF